MPLLRLEGIFSDAMDLVNARITADFVLLDRPTLSKSNIDFSQFIPARQQIVISHDAMDAVHAFENGAGGFLLKPVAFPPFIRTVSRFIASGSTGENAPATCAYRYFNVNKKMVRVALSDILYIESMKEYVHIHTPMRTIVTRMQLPEMEALLNHSNFLRVHRSFIVACDKILSFSAEELEIGTTVIPIGRTYQKKVKEQFDFLPGMW